MAILYSEIDKSDWYYQPNFVRLRHRYRGTRESYKINTEIMQSYYDINRMYAETLSIRDDLSAYSDILIDGGEIENCEYYWSQDDTPILTTVDLLGLEELSIRIEKLRNRVKILERGQ